MSNQFKSSMGIISSLKEKIKLPKNKNSQSSVAESYLSLTLTPDTVFALSWQFLDENVEVKGVCQKHFGTPQNLVHEAAIAIDKAAESASSDVNKVVFGLSANWFDGENLKNESAKLLNGLSQDLDLSAQAYVSLATAVNHFLKVEENITPNAVLLGIFDGFCEAHLVKNNKVVATEIASSKAEVGAIVELVRKIKEKHQDLPSRIVVYGMPDESLNSRLGKRNWQDIFMHEPKIDLLSEKELAKSVAYAQAADILGHDPESPVLAQHLEEEQENKKEQLTPKTEPEKDNLGFVAEEDILLTKQQEGDQLVEENSRPEELSPEPEVQSVEDNIDDKGSEGEEYAVEAESNVSQADFMSQISPSTQTHRKKNKFKIPNPLALISIFKFRPAKKNLAIAAVAIVLFLVVGIFAASLTLTSAQVVIKVNAKPQEADISAQVISGSGDTLNGRLPGNIVSGKADGNQKLVATGSKKSGTKAKGEVKILNWDKQASKTFASGTQVITKDGLKFSIDSEIEVASRSATTPGENKVAATAIDIGPKYNVNSGTDLTIVGFDEVFYSGVVETAFTGGDEKQITVVSRDDLDKLEKALTETLKVKAGDDLNSNSAGRKIYDEARTIKVLKKEFDKKVDEEASLINLDLSLEISALTFDENDLKAYLAKTAQDKAESNLEARPQNLEILSLNVKNLKDTLVLSGRFRANLTPKLDEDSLKEKIKGASTKGARETIKNTTGIADVQIIITPGIPFIDSLPQNKSKISFKIETQ